MLLQFNFSNYKSFRKDASLDLTATGISELSHHVVEMGGERVLPIAVLFGANASGKSNVYQAFEYMRHFVLNSFAFGGEAEDYRYPAPPNFAWVAANHDPTEFEIFFVDRNTQRTINYGFSLDSEGVVEEWLNTKAKTARTSVLVYYRSRESQESEYPGFSSIQVENLLNALDSKVLVASLGDKLLIDDCQNLVHWFQHCVTVNYGVPEENLDLCSRVPKIFRQEKVQDFVVSFFATFDPSIKGFTVEEIPSDGTNGEPRLFIEALHEAIDSDALIPIPLREESSGTIKMFSLFWRLIRALDRGSPFFVDELTARLHPLLVRNLILLFSDKETNPNHAQLIFTSHDTWHLSNNILRRDEIWFTAKANQESTLYSLADFKDSEGSKIRKDEDYEKNYLLGKYGAIPTLEQITCNFPDFHREGLYG